MVDWKFVEFPDDDGGDRKSDGDEERRGSRKRNRAFSGVATKLRRRYLRGEIA